MIYKCIVAYDGSKFSGWQKQPGLLTVQQSIEEALSIIHKEPIDIHGSGRTDKGVHAYHQVFHFESHLNMDSTAFHRALNALLPKSIHIHHVEAKEGFHARFDAIEKHYVYRVNLGPVDVFNQDYEFQLNKDLDIRAMEKACQLFIGTHDFTSFNATELAIIPNQVRTITDFILLENNDGKIEFSIFGDGFLRYMVRMLIAAVIEVGLHRLSVEELKQMLEARDKDVFTKNIPACGLYLAYVDYKE